LDITLTKYILLLALLYASWTDLKYCKIKNHLIIFVLFSGILKSLFLNDLIFILYSFLILILVFVVFWIPYKKGWESAGDIKLKMAVAFWLPPEQFLLWLIFASIFGALFSLSHAVFLAFKGIPSPKINDIFAWLWSVKQNMNFRGLRLPYAPGMFLSYLMILYLA
jgi:Flp pilus assembly protein protease CpaA